MTELEAKVQRLSLHLRKEYGVVLRGLWMDSARSLEPRDILSPIDGDIMMYTTLSGTIIQPSKGVLAHLHHHDAHTTYGAVSVHNINYKVKQYAVLK